VSIRIEDVWFGFWTKIALTSLTPFDILLVIMKEKKKNIQKENKDYQEPEKVKGIAKVAVTKDDEIENILKAGLQFGHRRDKKHPKMGPFIYGARNNILLIDILKTKEYLQKALDYLKQRKGEGAIILFVATKTIAKDMVKELAKSLKMPYITERWLGGTLTNFEIIGSQVEKLEEMEEKKKRGDFDKYTKKEKHRIDQNIEKITRRIGGLKTMKRLPDILFIVDVQKEKTAVREARKKGISIIGICDTNGDPSLVDLPIPANDDAPSSLKYILEKVKGALK